MPTTKRILIPLIFLLFIVPYFLLAQAQTIAVFPLDSQKHNSPNMEVTRYIANKLELKGLDVIQEQNITHFMNSEKIKWLGYLSSEDIRRTKEDLGADLVLLGTVINNTNPLSSYIIINIHRAQDAENIWVSSDGLGIATMQTLLGLNEPKTIDEIWPILVNKILASWPDNMLNDQKTH